MKKIFFNPDYFSKFHHQMEIVENGMVTTLRGLSRDDIVCIKAACEIYLEKVKPCEHLPAGFDYICTLCGELVNSEK